MSIFHKKVYSEKNNAIGIHNFMEIVPEIYDKTHLKFYYLEDDIESLMTVSDQYIEKLEEVKSFCRLTCICNNLFCFL